MSDLAGNAMSLSVVSSAMLAALCVKQFARERKKNPDYFLPEPKESEYVSRIHRTINENAIHQNKNAFKEMIHNLLQLAPQAMAASTLCVCETSGGKSDADILWCKDCGLCICRECANEQVNLSCHSMGPFEIVRCDPVTLGNEALVYSRACVMLQTR